MTTEVRSMTTPGKQHPTVHVENTIGPRPGECSTPRRLQSNVDQPSPGCGTSRGSASLAHRRPPSPRIAEVGDQVYPTLLQIPE